MWSLLSCWFMFKTRSLWLLKVRSFWDSAIILGESIFWEWRSLFGMWSAITLGESIFWEWRSFFVMTRGDHFLWWQGAIILGVRSFWESQFLGNGDPVLTRFRRAIVLGESIFREMVIPFWWDLERSLWPSAIANKGFFAVFLSSFLTHLFYNW